MTKFRLMQAFFAQSNQPESLLTLGGYTGRIVSMQREDGSGSSFLVTLACTINGDQRNVTKYVRTAD